MIVSCEVMFSVNGCSKTIEMKMFVVSGTILQKKITTIEIQNQNTFTTGKIGGSLSISQETLQNQRENVLTSTKRCLHQNVYTEKLEDDNSDPRPTGSTNNGNRHRVLPPPGGNGAIPGGLPKNSKKVNKRGLRSNGATRCLQIFGENPRRMAFTNSFYFVRDRPFTADGGLL